MLSRFAAIILLTLSMLAPIMASAALSCTVASACNTPDVAVFKLFQTGNSHAELASQSNYSKYVCCSGVSGISNSCSGPNAVTVLRLHDATNSHVEENTQGNYGNNACLSIANGTVTVGYQNSNCTGFDTTLASISGVTNAHVGDASAYPLKVCASATATVTPTPPPPTPPPSGGGGGGGPTSTTGITFSGSAYPLSRVTILKDGQLAITTIAGPDAHFTATVGNLSTGSYNFSVYAEDADGNRSTLFTFPANFTAGTSTTIGGIFLAPTIDTDKSQVKQGDNIAIFGHSVPDGAVTISVHSALETFHTVQADVSGAYLYEFDSSPLEYGTHDTKSKTAAGNQVTSFGNIVAFAVGDQNIPKTTVGAHCPTRGDLNNDCKVNLVDFSIMAYWYKKSSPPANVDLSGDHTVNLVDFSILAYNWTG
jgi:hypothetical protein